MNIRRNRNFESEITLGSTKRKMRLLGANQNDFGSNSVKTVN